MKFLSFILIFVTIALTVSVKLIVSNQENKLKKYNEEIQKLEKKIDRLNIDISYSTRPQKLKEINNNEFKLTPILQSDIITLEKK